MTGAPREPDTATEADRGLADRLGEAAHDLTRRWLDRISERVDLEPEAVFPSRDLLDHVPVLVEGVAAVLGDETLEPGADMALVRKAREIGRLRFDQGCSLHELVKELQIFDGILFHFLTGQTAPLEGSLRDGWSGARRLSRALATVRESALIGFSGGQSERTNEAQRRLRSVHRIVSHEMANRLGGALGAVEALETAEGEARTQVRRALERHLMALRTLARNAQVIAHVEEGRQESHVSLRAAANEAVRRVREMAEAGSVRVEIDGDLPDVEAPAAAIELCLTSYLSNAIQYADPASDDRWVRVEGWLEPGDASAPGRVVVRVRDNGIGVPPADRDALFEPFTRSEIAITRNPGGLGLGLSTVREVVESHGGEAWAELDRTAGAAFLFSLPRRRDRDPVP